MPEPDLTDDELKRAAEMIRRRRTGWLGPIRSWLHKRAPAPTAPPAVRVCPECLGQSDDAYFRCAACGGAP